jgi:hypothetical protein
MAATTTAVMAIPDDEYTCADAATGFLIVRRTIGLTIMMAGMFVLRARGLRPSIACWCITYGQYITCVDLLWVFQGGKDNTPERYLLYTLYWLIYWLGERGSREVALGIREHNIVCAFGSICLGLAFVLSVFCPL